jgi:protein TonB
MNIRYDETSRRRGEQGTVHIKAEIGKKGEILKAVIVSSSGYPRLDRIAVNAIRSASFTPTLRNGDPVKSEVEYKIVFRLDERNSLKVVEDDNVRILE